MVMKKSLIFIILISANILIAEDFLIKSKGYLDIQTGEIIKADILVSNGKIAEIGKIKKTKMRFFFMTTYLRHHTELKLALS